MAVRRRNLLLAFGLSAAAPFAVAGLVIVTHPTAREAAITLGALYLCLLPIVAVVSTSLQRDAREHERLANYDALTELPTRSLFTQRLQAALAGNNHTAVMVADIDLFKNLNDRYGHLNGDEALRCVAQRLTGAVRTSDTVARMGGDEFGLILPGATQEVAAQVARRIVAALDEPLELGDGTVDIAVSLGIACSPQHGGEHDTLLQRADFAMYAAKDSGGAAYRMAELSGSSRGPGQAIGAPRSCDTSKGPGQAIGALRSVRRVAPEGG